MKNLILIAVLTATILAPATAQVFSNKEVGKKNEELIDSLKTADYPYALPIWGQKATALGFTLPYSAGISVQYLIQESDLTIENLQIGFNNSPLFNLDEIVRFNSATSTASGVNIRPDFWLFPFLNVYGILAQSKPSTAVDFSIYVPDLEGEWSEIFRTNTEADFAATTAGFGITPTIGVGGGFMALDMNFTWSDIEELEDPAFAFVLGPRFGKNFKLKKPESSLALWVGAFRLKLNTGTTGSIPLDEIFETDGLQEKVDNGIDAVGTKQMQVDDWWNSLTAIEQANPVNKVRYETANRALDRAAGFLLSLDSALNDETSASVQYALDKRPKDPWNFIVGGQYQLNRHVQARAEFGFLGSRTQFIGGLQYRFGL